MGNMVISNTIIWDDCSICGKQLVVVFPVDFPDEFKFCCSCLQWAKRITVFGYSHNIDVLINDTIKQSPKLQRLVERITLVE